MHASSDPAPLLDALYQTIEDEQQWPVFLEGLAIHMSARSASLRLVDIDGPSVHRSWSHGYATELDFLYRHELYAHHNPLHEPIKRAGLHMLASHRIINDREYAHSRHFHELFQPHDSFYAAGGYLIRGDDGRAWQIGVHRSRHAGPFEARELKRLEYLAPHLRRAIYLEERLDASRRALEQTRSILDEVSFGVWLLDAKGLCQWMNQAADTAIREACAGLTLRHGRVGHRHGTIARNLNQAITAALDMPPQSDHIGLDTSGRGMLISPLSSPRTYSIGEDSGVLLLLLDPLRQQELNSDILRKQYQLTRAEARLARYLATGATLDTIAVEQNVSPHTVRSQLRALLRKTETGRQAELLRVLLLGPALRP